MGWRNYATTQQTGASFDNPSFPLASADFFARNFLGDAYPLSTSFTTVSTAVRNNRTDQAAMSRQELIKLQRTIGFSQSLLQYLGTFSRELNRPAPDWPRVNGNYLTERFDMTNLQLVIPGFKIRRGNGKGHQYGLNKKQPARQTFWLDVDRKEPSCRVLATLIPTITVIGNMGFPATTSTSCQTTRTFSRSSTMP